MTGRSQKFEPAPADVFIQFDLHSRNAGETGRMRSHDISAPKAIAAMTS